MLLPKGNIVCELHANFLVFQSQQMRGCTQKYAHGFAITSSRKIILAEAGAMKASMGRYTEELKKQMKDGSVMKV